MIESDHQHTESTSESLAAPVESFAPAESPAPSELPTESESPAPGESQAAAQSLAAEVEAGAVTLPTGDVSRAHLKGLIEALVFVSDHPISVAEIGKAAGNPDRRLVRALVDELRRDYARRGVQLDEVAGGLIFRTNAAFAPFIRDLAGKKPVRMTRAQLETMAIIAYRQPITRPEVDQVRGVDSGPVMKMLLDRDLVRILGKKDEPGRPLLYGTTSTFLELFGLKSLKDLPPLREFTELSDDSRRVLDRELGGDAEGAQADVGGLVAAASVLEKGAVGASEQGDPEASAAHQDREQSGSGAPGALHESEAPGARDANE